MLVHTELVFFLYIGIPNRDSISIEYNFHTAIIEHKMNMSIINLNISIEKSTCMTSNEYK